MYLLPLYPAAALLVGRWVDWLAVAERAASAPRALRGLSSIAQRTLGGAGLAAGVALGSAGGLALTGRSGILARFGFPFAGAVGFEPLSSAPVLAAALAAGLGLGLSGAALLRRWAGRVAARADLAFACATALFFCGVVHPIESAGRSVSAFYREVGERVGDGVLAGYGGIDHAANRALERRVVPDLGREQAEQLGREQESRGAPLWLVAEAPSLAREGTPDGFQEVLRHAPPWGTPLVLLRSDSGSAGHDRARVGRRAARVGEHAHGVR